VYFHHIWVNIIYTLINFCKWIFLGTSILVSILFTLDFMGNTLVRNDHEVSLHCGIESLLILRWLNDLNCTYVSTYRSQSSLSTLDFMGDPLIRNGHEVSLHSSIKSFLVLRWLDDCRLSLTYIYIYIYIYICIYIYIYI
jgi:hypothetical protein